MTAVIEIGGVDSDSRKKAVKKYFSPTPDPSMESTARRLLGGAGALGLLAIALLVVGAVIPAVGSVLVGLFVLQQGLQQRGVYRRRYDRAEPKPSDEQMDRLLRDDLHRASDRSLTRLGLTRDELALRSFDADPLAGRPGARLADQGRGPITVFGPAADVRGRTGADNVLRFTAYDVMVICPTNHHLGIYECRLDMASGRLRNEETREYHYEDVVAVVTTTTSTPETTVELLDKYSSASVLLTRAAYRSFEVIVSSGDRSSIVVGIKDEQEREGRFRLQESGIDSVISAVRQMLREKKGGVAPPL